MNTLKFVIYAIVAGAIGQIYALLMYDIDDAYFWYLSSLYAWIMLAVLLWYTFILINSYPQQNKKSFEYYYSIVKNSTDQLKNITGKYEYALTMYEILYAETLSKLNSVDAEQAEKLLNNLKTSAKSVQMKAEEQMAAKENENEVS